MDDKLIPADNGQLVPTAELITEWLDHEERMNEASANTITAYRRGIDAYRAWLASAGLAIETVTPADILDFKTDLLERYSPQTVNLRLVAVRSFYRFCVTSGRALLNPASQVKGAKRKKSRTHKRDALTNGEVVEVLSKPETGTLAGLRDKAVLILLAYCALRSVEIHRANIGDLRTRDDRLTLDIRGKGRIEADEFIVIPLRHEPVIREWLRHRLTFEHAGAGDPLFISLSNRSRGDRLTLRAIRAIVKDYYSQANIVGDRKTTHSLRHSAITKAIKKGATPLQVQAMARHQSFDTTLGYFHEVARLDNPAEDLISYGDE